MKMPRLTIYTCALLLIAGSLAAAQQPRPSAEPNYDITVQLIVGSNTGGGGLPSPLSAVERQLRSNFKYSSYQVSATYMGRAGNLGDLEYKSVTELFSGQKAGTPSFLEWRIQRLSTDPEARIQIESFRMGMRIPISTGTGEASSRPPVAYESIGLNLSRILLPLERPTLVGTLPLPDDGSTGFVVLTVNPASK